ncbi:MAG: DUF308 domain-containing protein [Ruminococcus sp.]|nr:DUF308 domain-containing protein [Ruminococcus sp.]
MKKMLKNYSLGALACIVMGVALMINPHIITDVLNTAVGVLIIAWAAVGIIGFIASRSSDSRERQNVFSLVGDVIMLLLGVYVFVNPKLLETIVMTALGIYLLCSGISKLASALHIKKYGNDRWLLPLITAVISTLMGGFIIAAPTLLSGSIMFIVGVVLTVAGIVNFVSGFSAARELKKLMRELDPDGGKPAKRERVRRSASKEASDGSRVIDVKSYDEE